MELMFDGWYVNQADAQAVLDLVAAQGATPVGVVTTAWDSYGAFYLSRERLFSNHIIDSRNAVWHVNV